MMRLASACKDKASQRGTGYAEENEYVAGMIDGTRSVVVWLVSDPVSSSESVLIVRSGDICLLLLNHELFRWLL